MSSDFMPLKPFEFTYRQIIYTGRNYEYMLPIHLNEFKDDLVNAKLWNEFTEDYTSSDNPLSLHNKYDLIRKQTIDQIITNGQILNLYLIKQRHITLEYLKLIAWAYTPLPPHYIKPTSQGQKNDL